MKIHKIKKWLTIKDVEFEILVRDNDSQLIVKAERIQDGIIFMLGDTLSHKEHVCVLSYFDEDRIHITFSRKSIRRRTVITTRINKLQLK